MLDALISIFRVAMMVFIVSSMAACGLGLSPQVLTASLRNIRLLILTIAANFLLAPLEAWVITRTLRLEPSLATGLLILSLAGGAPFLPRLVALARGNVGLSVGVMSALMVITAGVLPLAVPVMVSGATASPTAILRPLGLSMILPLAAAMLLHVKWTAASARLRPIAEKLSNVSLLVALILVPIASFRDFVAVFGTGGILAALLCLAAWFWTGWILAGKDRDQKVVLGLATGQRNIAAALVVAAQGIQEPRAVVMLVVTAALGLLFVPLARRLARMSQPATEPARP